MFKSIKFRLWHWFLITFLIGLWLVSLKNSYNIGFREGYKHGFYIKDSRWDGRQWDGKGNTTHIQLILDDKYIGWVEL